MQMRCANCIDKVRLWPKSFHSCWSSVNGSPVLVQKAVTRSMVRSTEPVSHRTSQSIHGRADARQGSITFSSLRTIITNMTPGLQWKQPDERWSFGRIACSIDTVYRYVNSYFHITTICKDLCGFGCLLQESLNACLLAAGSLERPRKFACLSSAAECARHGNLRLVWAPLFLVRCRVPEWVPVQAQAIGLHQMWPIVKMRLNHPFAFWPTVAGLCLKPFLAHLVSLEQSGGSWVRWCFRLLLTRQ